MKKINIFNSDNNEWTCSMVCGSSHSEFYSIVYTPLSIGPDISGTEFSGIFDSTKSGTGATYGYGYAIP
jgi:hypothetical protein